MAYANITFDYDEENFTDTFDTLELEFCYEDGVSYIKHNYDNTINLNILSMYEKDGSWSNKFEYWSKLKKNTWYKLKWHYKGKDRYKMKDQIKYFFEFYL